MTPSEQEFKFNPKKDTEPNDKAHKYKHRNKSEGSFLQSGNRPTREKKHYEKGRNLQTILDEFCPVPVLENKGRQQQQSPHSLCDSEGSFSHSVQGSREEYSYSALLSAWPHISSSQWATWYIIKINRLQDRTPPHLMSKSSSYEDTIS